jgi:hypothetical protein
MNVRLVVARNGIGATAFVVPNRIAGGGGRRRRCVSWDGDLRRPGSSVGHDDDPWAEAGTRVSDREALQIDWRTLKRWRQWWLDRFVRSSFWKAARARFMPPVCEQTLPLSLWLRFDLEGRQRLLAVLEFLSPMTTPAAWKEFAM